MKVLNSFKRRIRLRYLKRMIDYQSYIFKGLKFFAEYSKPKIAELKRTSPNWVRNKVSEEIESLLYKRNLISNNEKDCFDPLYMITQEGHNQFIELDKINKENWFLWKAILGIILTLLSIYMLTRVF